MTRFYSTDPKDLPDGFNVGSMSVAYVPPSPSPDTDVSAVLSCSQFAVNYILVTVWKYSCPGFVFMGRLWGGGAQVSFHNSKELIVLLGFLSIVEGTASEEAEKV